MPHSSGVKRTAPSHSTQYRSDIDGLRALAVCAVLLFHAFPKSFPGGFIGVDIFFVISGFLITGNIHRDIESGLFTIRGFYLRRVRRIFPALLLVLLCCLVVGSFILTRSEFRQLGKHTAAAAGFTANFFYWSESGYFDSAAISKPLLHLWSLGVEEQFYLVWPLLLIAGRKIGQIRQVALGILLVSFVGCVWTTSPLSYGAFYSPATRMWELALGGVLSLGVANNTGPNWSRLYSKGASMGSFCGIALIAISVWAFDSKTPYPGWKALLPTVGAALVIAGGKFSVLNRVVLSHSIVVFAGLISYPLYLWHWPLLSFAHIFRLGIVPNQVTVALLVISVALASGTYLLLELPLRRQVKSWKPGGGLVALMACVAISGGTVYEIEGARESSPINAAAVRSHSENAVPRGHIPSFDKSPPPTRIVSSEAPLPFVEGDSRHPIAPAGLNEGKSNPSIATGTSRLMLYWTHVSEAGSSDAYLNQMGLSRLTAVRSGVCEYADPTIEMPPFLANKAVCEGLRDGAKNIIVMGDSIASDTFAWLRAAYPEFNFVQRTGPGCNLQRADSDNPKPCTVTKQNALEIALSPREDIEAVVLASLWDISLPQDMGRTSAESLIDQLLARGRKVILVRPPVGFTVPPRDLVDKCPVPTNNKLALEQLQQCAWEHSTVYRGINAAMKQYAQQKGIGLSYLDINEFACNDSECPILDDEGQLMFTDTWHRSYPGDLLVAKQARQHQVLEQLLGARGSESRSR